MEENRMNVCIRLENHMRILKRLLLGLLAIGIGFVIILAGSIAVDYAIGSERISSVTNTTIPGRNRGPDVRAFVAQPQGNGPFPVVIMIHEFFGLNQSIVGKAKGLAEEGYLVVAPDTFRGSTTAWIPRAIYQVVTTKPEQVNQDLDAVYAWVESQSNAAAGHVGIVGFCYGGRTSLAYSLHNDRLAATVIFYGSPVTDPRVLESLPGPLLGIFGGKDNSISVEDVRAFKAALDQAGIPNEVTIYEGQPHAFVTDIEAIRSGGVQGEAWAQMLGFLDKNLKQGSTSQVHDQHIAYNEPFQWRYYLMLAYEHAFGTGSHHH
jgi:carboxymethylenebutenolidase